MPDITPDPVDVVADTLRYVLDLGPRPKTMAELDAFPDLDAEVTRLSTAVLDRLASIGWGPSVHRDAEVEGLRTRLVWLAKDRDSFAKMYRARRRQPRELMDMLEAANKKIEELTDPGPDYSGLVPYEMPAEGVDAIIVDLDGTLCRIVDGGRSPYDEHRVGEDERVDAVWLAIMAYGSLGYRVIFTSGRSERCRTQTEAWLRTHAPIDYELLLMRPAGDVRKDWLVKYEMFHRELRGYRIAAVLDDRNQVVGMWRSLGLPVFQVAPGDF